MNNNGDPDISFNSLENNEREGPSYSFNGQSPSSKRKAIIGGICHSIAEQLNTDPLIIRLAFVFSIFWGLWGVVLYLAVYAFKPARSKYGLLNKADERTPRKLNLRLAVSLVLIIIFFYVVFDLVNFLSDSSLFGIPEEFLQPFVFVGMGILIIVRSKPKSETSTSAVDRLSRSDSDKKLGGVCGGLSGYFNLNPGVMRLLWILFTIVTAGLGIIIYFLFVMMVPYDTQIAQAYDE